VSEPGEPSHRPSNLVAGFLGHAAKYFSAGVATALSGYGIVAVLTRLLDPAEFGVFTLFQAVASFIGAVAGWNFRGAAQRYYLEDPDDYPSFVRTTTLFLLASNVVLVAIVWWLRAPLGAWLDLEGWVIFFGVLVGVARVPWNLMWKVLVAQMRSGLYSKLSVVRDASAFVAVASGAWLYVDAGRGEYGAVLGMVVISATLALGTATWLFLLGRTGGFRAEHLRYALVYGVPLIPSTVAAMLLTLFDRIVIQQELGVEQTGIYSFAYNIGMVMSVGVLAMTQAIGPIFTRLRDQGAYEEIETTVVRMMRLLFAVSIGLTLFAREAAWVLGDERFFGGIQIVPWVVLGYFAHAFSGVYAMYPAYLKKTWWNASGVILAGTSNAALNLWLIPIYGLEAGAWTTFGSFVLLLGWNVFVGRWILKERIVRLRRWALWFVAALVLLPGIEWVMGDPGVPLAIRLVVKGVGALGCLALIAATLRASRRQ
jgi:O-antigen/teichoic acid export membrane protein